MRVRAGRRLVARLAPDETWSTRVDRAAVDDEGELAVEQHLDAVPPGPLVRGVGRTARASAARRLRAGSPSRPRPSHFWNAITALKVARPRGRRPRPPDRGSRARRACARRRQRRGRRRARRLGPASTGFGASGACDRGRRERRARESTPGKRPSGTPPLTSTLHRLHAAAPRSRSARAARGARTGSRRARAGGEPLAEVDRREPRASETSRSGTPAGTCVEISPRRSAGVGPASSAAPPHAPCRRAGRGSDLLALEERDAHGRGGRVVRRRGRSGERESGGACRRRDEEERRHAPTVAGGVVQPGSLTRARPRKARPGRSGSCSAARGGRR